MPRMRTYVDVSSRYRMRVAKHGLWVTTCLEWQEDGLPTSSCYFILRASNKAWTRRCKHEKERRQNERSTVFLHSIIRLFIHPHPQTQTHILVHSEVHKKPSTAQKDCYPCSQLPHHPNYQQSIPHPSNQTQPPSFE